MEWGERGVGGGCDIRDEDVTDDLFHSLTVEEGHTPHNWYPSSNP